jgi:hypothetical protein
VIRYYLEDKDSNTYNLNDASVNAITRNTMSLGEDAFEWESDIVEKTYNPGAAQLGKNRLASRSLEITYTRVNSESETFQDETNELIAFFVKSIYLIDVENSRRIRISPQSFRVSYETGSYKKYSNDSMQVICLNPYWEDITEQEITGSATGSQINAITINNNGSLPTLPTIELVSVSANTEVDLYLTDTQVGLIIDDDIFGTTGNQTMTVDFENGKITINDVRRNIGIRSGTGFFYFPQGSFEFVILPLADTDYTINYRRRYYI